MPIVANGIAKIPEYMIAIAHPRERAQIGIKDDTRGWCHCDFIRRKPWYPAAVFLSLPFPMIVFYCFSHISCSPDFPLKYFQQSMANSNSALLLLYQSLLAQLLAN